jgi:hypothetical protein
MLVGASFIHAADEMPAIRAVRFEPAFWLFSGFDSPPAPDDRARTVALYEKLEMYIDLEASFTNPYDPDQIDLWTDFTSPSGKAWRIGGFYNPSSATSLWMVRFAPTEVGNWRYVVKVKDAKGVAESKNGSFAVTPSARHGFVSIAPNQRYLRYSDGSSFYGVGLWYNDQYHFSHRGNITPAGLDELKKSGANFISFLISPLETTGTGLGRYDQDICARLDNVFRMCEERDIHIGMNIWFHNYLSQTIWGTEHAWYRSNPYRAITSAVDFFKSEEAWNYQTKLHRYIIARWGYSRALFLWDLVGEIDGTDAWQKGDRAAAEQWCRKTHQFFREHDPYHRSTAGTQSGAVGQWWPGGYRTFDLAAAEIYEAQGWPMPSRGKLGSQDQNPLQMSYKNYAGLIEKLWTGFGKPALIAECGWDHSYYEPGMPGYSAMYHNALWVSLANGLCATPFWWAYMDALASPASFSKQITDSVVTSQLLYFSRFVADIDFANQTWARAPISAGSCDAWAMKGDKTVFGWLANPRTSVADESFTVSGLPNGKYSVRLYHTWGGRYLPEQTVDCQEGKVTATIPELRPRGHAAFIGHDIAFKIQRTQDVSP